MLLVGGDVRDAGLGGEERGEGEEGSSACDQITGTRARACTHIHTITRMDGWMD